MVLQADPSVPVSVRRVEGGAGDVCRSVLAELPAWFGILEANDDYAEHADSDRGIVAESDGVAIGLTTLVQHSDHCAEVYLMAVRPAWHRHGVGTMMLREAERWLAADRVEFLQVKTLSASSPDPGYALTRLFYLAYGFRVLEEFPELWDPSNPALQLIKLVDAG